MNYWREWLDRADAGLFDHNFPAPDEKDPRVSDWQQKLEGTWDLRDTSIFNSRVILSRKRTRNFLDAANLWKRSVLENLEEQAIDDVHMDAVTFAAKEGPFVPEVNMLVAGPSNPIVTRAESDDEIEHVGRRYSSGHSTDAWRSGATQMWGRGSRP